MGRDEGRILGLEKGFDIGYEVGLYMGCVLVLTSQRVNMMNITARESKVHRHVDALYRLLSCDLGSSEGAIWWDPHVRCLLLVLLLLLLFQILVDK